MPLLISPIDGSPMRQINRFGIELDVCPTSGGVWLDRGELEKLMAFMKQVAEEEASMMSVQHEVPHHSSHSDSRNYPDPYASRPVDPRSYPSGHSHDPRHYDKRYDTRKPYKQKTGLQRMMDIFDFD